MHDVPRYTTDKEHPIMCQSSRWLSMNVFSLTHEKIVVEENEKPMIHFLEQEHGFDVVPMAYRNVYEFGGSLHCSTWDVRRRGNKQNYFPERSGLEEDIGMTKLTDLP